MICFDEKKVTIILRKKPPEEFIFASKKELDAAVEEWFRGPKREIAQSESGVIGQCAGR